MYQLENFRIFFVILHTGFRQLLQVIRLYMFKLQLFIIRVEVAIKKITPILYILYSTIHQHHVRRIVFERRGHSRGRKIYTKNYIKKETKEKKKHFKN